MAKCLCCGKTSKNPNAPNWKLWQLCYLCGTELHPDYYEGKPKHGTGDSWMAKPPSTPMHLWHTIPENRIKYLTVK